MLLFVIGAPHVTIIPYSDMRGLAQMREAGCPVVVYNTKRSVPQPGENGLTSSRQREMAPVLTRPSVASGLSGILLETYPDPETAPSDGRNMWPLNNTHPLLEVVKALDRVAKTYGFIANV